MKNSRFPSSGFTRCSLSSTSLRWGDSERGRKEEWARYGDAQEKEGKEEMKREREAGREEKKEGKKGRRKREERRRA